MKLKSNMKNVLAGFLLLLVLLFSMGVFATGSLVYAASADEDDSDENETHTSDDDDGGDHDDDEEKDDDDDDVDDDKEAETKRKLEFEQSDNQFKIKSELESGADKDEFEVKFKLEDELSIEFEYESEAGSLETELELEVEFLSLTEFTDLNGNGYLDAGDTELSTMDLSKAKYDDFQYLISTTTDGETLYEVWTQTNDSIFLVRMYVLSGFGVIDGSTVTPTEVKIDIEIHDYPYVNNGSLALRLELKTEVETEVEKDDESPDEAEGLAAFEEAVAFTSSSSYLGFFSWVMTAMVDGVSAAVVSGPLESKESKTETEQDEDETEFELEIKGEMVLSYPYGIDIVHDPKVGVVTSSTYDYLANQSSDSTTAPGFLGITVIALAVLGALLFTNRRHGYRKNR
ncbi:MAG: hypothetical protein ACXAB4_12790 [Candidatus Hodarchaeales archaeon]|jgi:hypothetical protein